MPEAIPMTCTSKQVQDLMKAAHFDTVHEAALKAGMSVETARKYIKAQGEIKENKRRPRTGQGAFTEVWSIVEEKLKEDPGLTSRQLLGWLIEEHPGKFHPKQLRTLQRLVSEWLALYGPDKEVWFEQTDGPPIRSGPPEKRNVAEEMRSSEMNLLWFFYAGLAPTIG